MLTKKVLRNSGMILILFQEIDDAIINPEKFMFHKSVEDANEDPPDPALQKIIDELLKNRINTPIKITTQEELNKWCADKLKRPKASDSFEESYFVSNHFSNH